jgi:uncharacterized caspase-like protein
MRPILRSMLLTVALLALAALGRPGSAAPSAGEQRVALVMGNSAYPGAAALRNPVNDARAIEAKLRALGFDVTTVENGTKQQMERAIGLFSHKLNTNTISLFFYAGHGMQVNGKNFLLPIDAEIETEQTVRLEAVDVDAVLDQMSGAQGRFNIVILDACRNNPFEHRFRGRAGGLASIDAPAGSYIAYATAPGKVAADGTGENGLYTSELLAALDAPDAKIEDVFKHVRASVIEKSGGNQTPWESSSLTGDFYFKPPSSAPGAAPALVAAPAQPSQSGTEALFWDSIKASNDPADFRAYLDQYPTGSFVALARNRIAALAAAKPPSASRSEPQLAAAAPPPALRPPPASVPSPTVAASNAPPAIAKLSGAFAAPKPGTKLFYGAGGNFQVGAVNGRTVELTNLKGEPVPPLVGLFFRPPPEGKYDHAAIEAIWPLEIGKTVSTVGKGPKGADQLLTLRVVKTETVEVAAGRFDCFVVDLDLNVAHGKWVGRFRNWYAPALGVVVKNQLEMLAGERPPNHKDWELTGFVKP